MLLRLRSLFTWLKSKLWLMFMHYAGSLSLLFIVFLLLFMLIFPSTLVYRLSLVCYVSFFCRILVFSSSLAGLLGLLILLVYVGAIIVIIRYICAVSPNIKYYFSIRLFVACFLVFLVLLGAILLPYVTMPFSTSLLSPSFIFRDVGVTVLIILSLFIILILIYSTYMSPVASSLRSSN